MKKIFLLPSVVLFVVSGCLAGTNPKKTEQSKQKLKKQAQQNYPKLSAESPFEGTYRNLLEKPDPTVEKQAIVEAFQFLDRNWKGLQKSEDICLHSTNKKNRKSIRNLECLIIADYSKEKTKTRLLLVNPKTGETESFLTAHGKGSNRPEERETGVQAIRFSNVPGSNMTSLGFYLTDFLITSKKNTFGEGPQNGLMLDGINCTNDKARNRQVIMHTAQYVPDLSEKDKKVGNSEGCITLPKQRKDILKKCAHGALVYAHGKNPTTQP